MKSTTTILISVGRGRNTRSVMGNNMQKIAIVLNFPWSLLGFLYGMLLLPASIKMDKAELVVIIKVKRLWINEIFLMRRVRGFTLGNTVLLSDVADGNTYSHEIVHVEQFTKMPLLFPLLYLVESMKNGYQANKYEKEAYQRTNKPA